MPKNILIFSDGTGQAGGLRPDQRLSNVYKLYRATRTGPDSPIDPAVQVAYYDPGLGTVTSSGSIRLSWWQAIKSAAGLAVGLGFNGNVIDCYEAILRHYEPGDRIYLFGFSRGGYTARVVANVLNLCGVPMTDGTGGPLPRSGASLRKIATEAVIKVYGHGVGHPRERFEDEREALARGFRAKYQSGEHPNRAAVYPEFIGVFDAVAALGLNGPERVAVFALGAVALVGIACALGGVAQAVFDWPWLRVAAGLVTGAAVAAALAYAKATIRFSPKAIRTQPWPLHFTLWLGQNFDGFWTLVSLAFGMHLPLTKRAASSTACTGEMAGRRTRRILKPAIRVLNRCGLRATIRTSGAVIRRMSHVYPTSPSSGCWARQRPTHTRSRSTVRACTCFPPRSECSIASALPLPRRTDGLPHWGLAGPARRGR